MDAPSGHPSTHDHRSGRVLPRLRHSPRRFATRGRQRVLKNRLRQQLHVDLPYLFPFIPTNGRARAKAVYSSADFVCTIVIEGTSGVLISSAGVLTASAATN